MLRNKLVRSDGSIIDSSVIISCEFTEEVNSGENLSVGDVTASELSLEIRATTAIEQNEVLTYYIIEDGVETLIGVFNAEKPTVASRTSIRFSAYDNVVKSEKIISEWLRNNQNLFPMTLGELVARACEQCGLNLAASNFPKSDIMVNKFYADDITCRQILSWAAAIAGRFVRANVNGDIEFAWYGTSARMSLTPGGSAEVNSVRVNDDGKGNISITSPDATVFDDGKGNVSIDIPSVQVMYSNGVVSLVADGSIPYKQGGITYEAYTTDRIERVQIKHSDDDVGVIYPLDATGNCFVVRGNMILGACSTEVVTEVATHLYEQLCDISYVPAQVAMMRTIAVRAGDIVNIQDTRGAEFTTYVMKMSVTPSGTNIESTGNKSYDTNAAVSSERYSNLTGKVLEVKKTVDGLMVKAEDLNGKVSGLELTTESFKTYVENNFVTAEGFESYKSTAEQTAKDFTEKFESLDQYRNETSAHIKSGLLGYAEDNTPMYGIEIGQRTTNDGEEIFNRYARFTSDKLSFYDHMGDDVASVGYRKMSIANVEVTGRKGTDDHGSFKQGGYMDITLADGSIITKWVGGS